MRLRRIGLLLLALLLAIIFIFWLIHYLTFGTIVVTTDSRYNQITLTSDTVVGSTAKPTINKANGSLKLKLHSGGYKLFVQGNLGGMSEYVRIKAHTTNRFNITLPSPTGVEPVTYDNAQDVVSDGLTLVYLNSNDGAIKKIGPQNQLSSINVDTYNIKSIQWADTNYGVGQNSKGQLFIIKNGVVNPLQSPVPALGDPSAVFAVAANHQIYIGLGSNVYVGTDSSSFKKIYSHLSPSSLLYAGLNRVGINSGIGATIPAFTTVDNTGKQSSIKFSAPLEGASAWSEHDKYIAVIGSSGGEVLDSGFSKVATIPSPNINNPVWLGDNTVIYSVGDQLWSYGLQTQSSRLIANMPQGDLIQQLSVSSDKSYVYITLQDGLGNISIRRVGLNNQKVPSYIFQLQDILPHSTPGSGYTIGLVNFSGTPVIQVDTARGGPANAQQLASQELQSDGFDLSKFQVQVIQGN